MGCPLAQCPAVPMMAMFRDVVLSSCLEWSGDLMAVRRLNLDKVPVFQAFLFAVSAFIVILYV